MKRGALLKLKVLTLLSVFGSFLILNPAHAAVYSFTTTSGGAAHSADFWGQTFTIPAGKSGTISSITNIRMAAYNNPGPDVGRVRIYDSPSKSNLLATATSDFTIPASSGWSATYTFTANFPPFAVVENTQYFLELERISGLYNYYFFESSGNPYAGGSSYRGGVIDTSYDLGFTVNISVESGPVALSLGLTSGGNQVIYRNSHQLKVTTNTPSQITFYANKKVIVGCRRVITSANIAYCNWKPSVHGAIALSALAVPTDSANFSSNTVNLSAVGVSKRTNNR